ncbi:MAG: hypothetical protein A2X61_16650 [Ignavibacteria bacterium GWB2_35_12]|nr:MAG: hypothetical protein A2X63_13095 [Ignavibacteria bacterium GWA2_35_8]OGU37988.1 MAG: hypothetical protein A2X61_16650 [Ignavibacteria bacterium GWB2_35_12]OGU95674.1 MAG: hypothetical protein A2220_04300 [Ignavibacteria bacterium RIFOXYA2_FULL_35_10]OGV25091.1 MAG: hypothetical protein A2475_16980 [Ignavibacteria bacterium RIFOXYC2_FULL_35_21]
MQNTTLDYKKLINKELDNMPAGTYPGLYNYIKNLSQEFKQKKGKHKKTKLKGLWSGVKVSDELINEAKNSLFKGSEF